MFCMFCIVNVRLIGKFFGFVFIVVIVFVCVLSIIGLFVVIGVNSSEEKCFVLYVFV